MLAAMGLAPALQAQTASFNGTVALSSQLFDRGQAITGHTPVLQGAAFWTFPAGWSLGVSGSVEARSPGHLAETLVQASRDWSLSGDWQVQANLLYYTYDTKGDAAPFDRTEAGLHWTYRDVLTFGLSASHVSGAAGRPRAAADLGVHWPLARHLYLSAGVGVAESAPGAGRHHRYDATDGYYRVRTSLHRYGHAGLLWSKGPWQIELDRIVADAAMRRQWRNADADPWVATISRSF
ncbi:MAG TPA: hypothetical protein VFJ04_03400 [Rhodanobacteraceae bacterium]|nr:hypothetical protein [Rhodanobacteraceae bacterium]